MEYRDVSENIHLERIKRIKDELDDIIRSMECEMTDKPEYISSSDNEKEDNKVKIDSESSNKLLNNVKSRKHKTRISRVNVNV